MTPPSAASPRSMTDLAGLLRPSQLRRDGLGARGPPGTGPTLRLRR